MKEKKRQHFFGREVILPLMENNRIMRHSSTIKFRSQNALTRFVTKFFGKKKKGKMFFVRFESLSGPMCEKRGKEWCEKSVNRVP